VRAERREPPAKRRLYCRPNDFNAICAFAGKVFRDWNNRVGADVTGTEGWCRALTMPGHGKGLSHADVGVIGGHHEQKKSDGPPSVGSPDVLRRAVSFVHSILI
jgi:hypothetical protein